MSCFGDNTEPPALQGERLHETGEAKANEDRHYNTGAPKSAKTSAKTVSSQPGDGTDAKRLAQPAGVAQAPPSTGSGGGAVGERLD